MPLPSLAWLLGPRCCLLQLLLSAQRLAPARPLSPPSSLGVQGSIISLVRFSRGGPPRAFLAVVAGGHGWVQVWSVTPPRCLRRRRVQRAPISCLALSPNGALLATASAEGDVLVLGAAQLELKLRVRRAHHLFITGLDFAPDSRCAKQQRAAPRNASGLPWQPRSLPLVVPVGILDDNQQRSEARPMLRVPAIPGSSRRAGQHSPNECPPFYRSFPGRSFLSPGIPVHV